MMRSTDEPRKTSVMENPRIFSAMQARSAAMNLLVSFKMLHQVHGNICHVSPPPNPM